ncbi:MAG: hypothetical protein EDR02_05785 [Actinobacteria bacterium]|nr:MAG: hypothetical protein EDR02_05785 [Actinomycetota bacterium]RIK08153.1 MAG: hypothetical protein DCC48_01905 [Acidobacteriota bacterium]
MTTRSGTKKPLSDGLDYLRTSEALVPRLARRLNRRLARWRARRAEGSVAAYMDRVVEQATSGAVGSGAAPRSRR